MTASDRTWDPRRPLGDGERVLLEASAGTGKTYQTEGLVVRLVAEYDVPIERVLVITFTKAATADLRKRVRERLERARDALRSPGAPHDPSDPVIASLRQGAPADLIVRRDRLDRALASYDQAPISTIHGFCQRALQELALEADRDPDLDVVSEADAVREQLVADALAWVYSEATEEELAVLEDMGWTSANLDKLTRLMTAPTEPAVEPDLPCDGDGPLEALATARGWRAQVASTRAWLASDDGAAARVALEGDSRKTSGRLVKGIAERSFAGNWPKLTEWLELDGPTRVPTKGGANRRWIRTTWTTAYLDNKGIPYHDCDFPGFEVYRRVTALLDTYADLAPRPLVAFAKRVRADFEAELARRAWLTYDGMLSGLAERLAHPTAGPGLAQAIRDRYDVAIVDEFQDTDGAQWGILRAVFHAAGRRFYAVGDPKQAIYSFRNANLSVYLAAAGECDDTWRLPTNFRSDGDLVAALNHLWTSHPAPFDDPQIVYARIDANAQASRVTGLPSVATAAAPRPRRPLELRLFDASAAGLGAGERLTKPMAEAIVAELCGAECLRLLESGAKVDSQSICPQHLAVLVRTHRQGELVRRELQRRGIPAVAATRASVFHSDAATWLVAWLEAVANPTYEGACRRLALTPLLGWTAARLNAALSSPTGDEPKNEDAEHRRDWERLRQEVGDLARRWGKQGVFRVFASFGEAHGVFASLIGSAYGERAATDLRHLLELAHAEERRARPGPRGLADWLRRLAADEAEEEGEFSQRLESDAAAVQIVTMHACKGLQYPVTLVPFAWGPDPIVKDVGPIRYDRVDADGGKRAVVNLEVKKAPQRTRAIEEATAERVREDMRLLYVALTRAKHHVVAWVPTTATKLAGPLRQLLQLDGDDAETLAALASASAGTVGWAAEASPAAPRAYADAADATDTAALVARPWPADRRLGASWQVASYSSLSRGKGNDPADLASSSAEVTGPSVPPGAAEHVVDHGIDLEPHAELIARLSADDALRTPVAAGDLPGGTGTGLWLHAVLEHVDFAGRGKAGEPLADVVAAQARARGVTDARHIAKVVELVPSWLRTPLDTPPSSGAAALPAGFSLSDVALGDRLDELEFDLRLGDGVDWRPTRRAAPGDYTGRVDPSAVRLALNEARDAAGFDGAAWLAGLLDAPPPSTSTERERRLLPAIAGVLTGSIDLVFRVDGQGADARYFVADYKSNVVRGPEAVREWLRKLDPRDDPDFDPWKLRRLHYTRPLLSWAMAHAAYPLQALIYTVALHRLLRQRLGEAYAYERHVGGHLYLFLRGMEGPGSPRFDGAALGVYADRWPERAVVGLDLALAGESPKAVSAAMARCGAGGRR